MKSTICWLSNWGQSQAFVCTPVRHVCGTERLNAPPIWTISGTKCGISRALKSWAHQSGHHSLLKESSTRGWRTRQSCGKPFHGSRTCSRAGKSFSSARVCAATTFCELCPPSQSAHYAAEHDEGTQRTMRALLGDIPGSDQEKQDAARLATLPMRLGGLGLRAAVRMAPAAYWASWADALPMLQERLPVEAQNAVNVLDGHADAEGCLGEVREAAAGLDRQGFIGDLSGEHFRWEQDPLHRPTLNLVNGHTVGNTTRLPLPSSVAFAQSSSSYQAHLRSHSGSGCSHVLLGCPTRPEFKIEPGMFRVLILERLRVPLPVTEAWCECGAPLDCQGHHRAACPHSGRLRTRALAPERTLARVCREAGATVRWNLYACAFH